MAKPKRAKKKKKSGVGVDFARVKQKVGKKLAPAANETNTTVKARTINLPSQSLAVDKSGSAVTHRNLTLKVRHHATAQRMQIPMNVQCPRGGGGGVGGGGVFLRVCTSVLLLLSNPIRCEL